MAAKLHKSHTQCTHVYYCLSGSSTSVVRRVIVTVENGATKFPCPTCSTWSYLVCLSWREQCALTRDRTAPKKQPTLFWPSKHDKHQSQMMAFERCSRLGLRFMPWRSAVMVNPSELIICAITTQFSRRKAVTLVASG